MSSFAECVYKKDASLQKWGKGERTQNPGTGAPNVFKLHIMGAGKQTWGLCKSSMLSGNGTEPHDDIWGPVKAEENYH